ncbi:MAG: hypothetical protein C5B59_12805 [Bacteroidetes bacterium]|nr:MAG: hypothetical protein C5B59_12805 [Bacteroidota bacterium]
MWPTPQPAPAPTQPAYPGGPTAIDQTYYGPAFNQGVTPMQSASYNPTSAPYGPTPSGGSVLGTSTSAPAPSAPSSGGINTSHANQPGYFYDSAHGWVPIGPPSQPDIGAQVNSAYQSALDALNQEQSRLQGNEQNFYNSYTAPYDQFIPQAQQARQAGMNLNAQQVSDTQQNYQNAIAAARDLFNQVNQGAAQRFGGSTGIGTGVSSAADFANAFYSKALGENETQLFNTKAQNLGGLQTQAQNIESQYQNQLQQIANQKASALNQAQQVFQQQLSAINSQRAQIGVDKAAQALSALQNYQNYINSVTQQSNQLISNLTLQQNAARLGIGNGLAGYNTMAQTPQNMAAYQQMQMALPGQQVAQGYNPWAVTGQVGGPNQQQNQQQQNPFGFSYPQFGQVNLQ